MASLLAMQYFVLWSSIKWTSKHSCTWKCHKNDNGVSSTPYTHRYLAKWISFIGIIWLLCPWQKLIRDRKSLRTFLTIFMTSNILYRHLISVAWKKKTVAVQYLLHLPIFHYKLEKLPLFNFPTQTISCSSAWIKSQWLHLCLNIIFNW